jgi:hypothetical protein
VKIGKNKLIKAQLDNDRAFEAFAEVAPRRSRIKASAEKISSVVTKIKPKSGFSQIVHVVLTALLPLAMYVLIRIEFAQLALLLVLLSKWRMFSVKARHWPANIRANAIDIIVGLSTVMFMNKADSQGVQFTWVILYLVWLLYIKPKSTILWVAAQAIIGQAMGLMALFAVHGDASSTVLVLTSSLVCYFAARHYFSAFDETLGRTIAYVWAYFAASVVWLLSHWLIYYGVIAQPVVIISVVGYTLAGLYYLRHSDRLSINVQRQFVIVLTAILLILIVFSDWGDKTI